MDLGGADTSSLKNTENTFTLFSVDCHLREYDSRKTLMNIAKVFIFEARNNVIAIKIDEENCQTC